MLTAKIQSSDKITGITFGADDSITKPFHPLEVLARIKAQLRRAEIYNHSMLQNTISKDEIYHIHGLEINPTEHSCHLYGKEISPTPTEFAIVLYLCRHMGQAVSTEVLFEQIWGEKCKRRIKISLHIFQCRRI